MNEESKCMNCFTCEKGVSPDKTRAMLQEELAKNGMLPKDWFIDGEGQEDVGQCASCEKCFTAQSNCKNCYTCEKCYDSQEADQEVVQEPECSNCFTCEKCITQEGSCDNCFTCEKGYGGEEQLSKKWGGERHPKKPTTNEKIGGITYFIFPTNQCNLRCDYCYATKRPMVMDKELADKVMHWIVYDEEERNPGRAISIQFFGGEPTMEWDLVQHIVHTMEKYGDEILNRKIRFGMTTNGTLLTEERLQWMKAHNLTPLLSLDGRRETHDKHRIYANGSGSWKDIDFDMFLKYYPNPEIRPTILPDTVETWADDLAWFHAKGCYTVATEVAYEADWDDEAMAHAYKTYKTLCDVYIELKRQGKRCWMKFIDDGRNFMGVSKQTGYVCGIARNTVAIDALGNLYACQRYASFANPALKLGDVQTGWDKTKLRQTMNFKREMEYPDPKSGFECETCVAQWRCRGGCNAMNFQVNSDRRIILENHCKFQRMWAELALYALASTGELWEAFKGNKR